MGVARGKARGHAPYRRLSGFFTAKMAKVTLFSLPEVFYGPQICQKFAVAGALPRTPLGELTTLPRPPNRLGKIPPNP